MTRHFSKKILLLLAAIAAGIFFALAGGGRVFAAQNTPDSGSQTGLHDLFVRIRYGDMLFEYRTPDIVYAGGFDAEAQKKFTFDELGRITGQRAPFVCRYALRDIDRKLADIAALIDIEPVPAEVSFAPDTVTFRVTGDQTGLKVDTAALKKRIDAALGKGQCADIDLKPEVTHASVTTESLKRAFFVRQQFDTDFSHSLPERRHNIALALSCFNGMVIAPGQEVSFNKTVGKRTEERGYKTAKIIVGGEFTDGTGGGVCQVSTTLYNALLLADVKILEHHNHSLAVSYVPHSFDAMVNWSTADLRFKNDSGNYLFIKTWVRDGRATVRIYGETLPYRIVRRSTVLKTHLPAPPPKVERDTDGKYKNVYAGQRAVVIPSRPRLDTKGELLYYNHSGKLIKTKFLRKDTYQALPGLEIIGTTPAPPPPPPPAVTELPPASDPSAPDSSTPPPQFQ